MNKMLLMAGLVLTSTIALIPHASATSPICVHTAADCGPDGNAWVSVQTERITIGPLDFEGCATTNAGNPTC